MKKLWLLLTLCLLATGFVPAHPAALVGATPALAPATPPAATRPAPAQSTCDPSQSFGTSAALALSQKVGYIDTQNGFRYQALLAIKNPSGTPAGQFQTFPGQNTAEGRTQITGAQVVAADLNNSGYKQLVTAFRDSGFSYTRPGEVDPLFERAALQIVALDYTQSVTATPVLNRWRGRPPVNARFDVGGLAAGNLGFHSSNDNREELALTTLEATEEVGGENSAYLYLFQGNDKNGAGAIAHDDHTWLSRTILPGNNPQQALVAIGTLGSDDASNVVTALRNNNGSIDLQVQANRNQQLATLAATTIVTSASEIALAVGDVDGSFSDSIVLAANVPQGTGTQLVVSTWRLVPDAVVSTTLVLSRTGSWIGSPDAEAGIQLGLADLDADGREEIILADQFADPITGNADNISTRITSIQAGPPLTTRDFSKRTGAGFGRLALGTGTLDTSGIEVVVLGLDESAGQTGPQHTIVALAAPADKGFGVVAGPLRDPLANQGPLVVADLDGLRGLYAQFTSQCRAITESHLNAVVYVPPFWSNFNAAGTGGRYGIGTTNTSDNGTTSTTSKGASINASLGLGFKTGADFFVTGAEGKVIVNATYAHDWFSNATRGTSLVTTTATSIAQSNVKDFVIFDQTDYLCYNYQVQQDGAPINDGNLLACLPTSPQLPSGRDVGSWTEQAGTTISRYQWMPAVREWTNLTIGSVATQSSTQAGGDAARAIDGSYDGAFAKGSVTQTASELNPWWQVDLGSVQALDIVSIWNRTDECCYSNTQNFNLFISETPFSSNDPAVLAGQPGVWNYKLDGQPGPATHVITKKNGASVRGRYLRIQLNGTTSLGLAEVQAFSLARPDPDQFPVAVNDPDPDDGVFDVTMRNGQVRKVHGTLIWPGADSSYPSSNDVPQQIVDPGNNALSWSLRRDVTDRRLLSQDSGENSAIGIQVESEFGIKNGPVVKATLGGRYSWGYRNGSSNVTGFGRNFEISGNVGPLPATAPLACGYRFQPYFYETTGQSNYGFVKKYRVVDYIVPQVRGLTLGQDISACRQRPAQATLISSANIGRPGSSFVFTASGLPGNVRATVAIKGPDDSSFRDTAQLTTSADGQLVFVLLTTATSKPGIYTIRITAQSSSAATLQGTSAETSFTVQDGAPLLGELPPGDPPRIDLPSLGPVYLPLVRR